MVLWIIYWIDMCTLLDKAVSWANNNLTYVYFLFKRLNYFEILQLFYFT